MFCQFPRNTCIRKQEIHSRKNRAVSAEALLQQLLLLLLVTLPFPSFTTNTTWKARKLFNNNRDAHENSHHFTMDLGYHVSDVPPSDGPLQIRTWSLGTFLQWKQQCHNDHQGQLVPMEHPVHRQGCANDQPRRYHQVPVEFHFPGRTPGYTNSPFLWPGKAPSAAGAMRQLQQVEFFMKIPTAESNNERRRKNLSYTIYLATITYQHSWHLEIP